MNSRSTSDTMRELAQIAAAARERNHARDQIIATALELRAAIEAHPDLADLAATLEDLDLAEEHGRRLVARISGADQEPLLRHQSAPRTAHDTSPTGQPSATPSASTAPAAAANARGSAAAEPTTDDAPTATASPPTVPDPPSSSPPWTTPRTSPNSPPTSTRKETESTMLNNPTLARIEEQLSRIADALENLQQTSPEPPPDRSWVTTELVGACGVESIDRGLPCLRKPGHHGRHLDDSGYQWLRAPLRDN